MSAFKISLRFPNNMGDSCHDVRFEKVNQSQGKVDYMRKFAETPRSIILMQGSKGLGKTYSAMAICELYTRTRNSAMFMTQKQMLDRWMETFKADKYDGFIDKVKTIEILVIDDFGTGELSKGFLSFFMDIINTRMQWTNRGTVITTNLDNSKIGGFCGDALTDRLNTGQKFEFSGESRRNITIL
jgi:DNA replication protein DnaC